MQETNSKSSFIWHDGGRAASGYVGYAGDCCTRSVAIATGQAYRSVYDQLGVVARKTPRNGVVVQVFEEYLSHRGWKLTRTSPHRFSPILIPNGAVIVHVNHEDGRCNHVCAVIDQTVYDTWNAADDDEYVIRSYWTPPENVETSGLRLSPSTSGSQRQELSQDQFEKVLRRLRALDRTAGNAGSTEAEKRNAIRMMQQMMLANNLTREDISEQEADDSLRFTKMQCFLNGRKACSWEKMLAAYVCQQILTTVQFFLSSSNNRRLFVFYGPVNDVSNAISLFRELLVSIAAAAHLKYGSYARGSGASYCEGYVDGLPRNSDAEVETAVASEEQRQLVATRLMTIHDRSREWLRKECNIRLQSSRNSGRTQQDPAAMNHGHRDGSRHSVGRPGQPKRIDQR